MTQPRPGLMATGCALLLMAASCGGRAEPAAQPGVTFQDYERAFWAFMQCAEEGGWELVEPPEVSARQRFVYQLYKPSHVVPEGQTPSAEEGFTLLEEVEVCNRDYFTDIDRAWTEQNLPTEQELTDARRALGACVREAGYEYPEEPSTADWEAWDILLDGSDPAEVERFWSGRACMEKIQEEFALHGQLP